MRTSTAVFAGLLCSVLVHAAAPPKPPRKAASDTPPACIPQGPDYVPGVDAYGRPVKPADMPSGTQVIVSTEVYPVIRSQNPQLQGTGVQVRIEGLGQPPKCRPKVKTPTN